MYLTYLTYINLFNKKKSKKYNYKIVTANFIIRKLYAKIN